MGRKNKKNAPAPEDIAAAIAGFDLEDPEFPRILDALVLTAGNYPYDRKMKSKDYEETLKALQIQLVKLQAHVREKGLRLVALFEGRDAAGKGGSIFNFTRFLNPRAARIVALTKPTETERGEWYFQRYVRQLPTSGEIALFDRSWYNRAGVEPVMGFCSAQQTETFLEEAPRFEHMLVRDGVILFKFWLNIAQTTQLKRFHDRRHDPLRVWKLSPIDIEALTKFDAYTAARDRMLAATNSAHAPWTIVRMNDKRRGRIEIMRHVLRAIDFPGRDLDAIGTPDDAIVGLTPQQLAQTD